MAKQQKGKSGGNKKIGRDLEKCKRYARAQIRYKNKERRNKKRIAGMPKNKQKKILAQIKIHRKGFILRNPELAAY
jgi:hypothetical protein